MRILTLETGCKSKNFSRGFTLIEVLVVILIIGITTTLITLNFSSLNSIEKQSNSIDKRLSYLTEESIITGRVIGWYATNSGHYAAYLSNNDPIDENEFFLETSWDDNSSLKKIFKYADGTYIELGNDKAKKPILIFYPSGENSGGQIDIYNQQYIKRIIIFSNGKTKDEIISY